MKYLFLLTILFLVGCVRVPPPVPKDEPVLLPGGMMVAPIFDGTEKMVWFEWKSIKRSNVLSYSVYCECVETGDLHTVIVPGKKAEGWLPLKRGKTYLIYVIGFTTDKNEILRSDTVKIVTDKEKDYDRK